jgi:hypothetical protein
MRQQVNSQRASAASTRRKLITSLLGANSSRRYSAFMATDDEEEGQPPLNVLQCCSDPAIVKHTPGILMTLGEDEACPRRSHGSFWGGFALGFIAGYAGLGWVLGGA